MNLDLSTEEHNVIWRRLDAPGHEAVRVYGDEDAWYLDGAAVFLQDGKTCRLEYLIECDLEWRTVAAAVDGWVGDEMIDCEIEVKPDGIWYMNGENISAVKGCVDIDLSFSPSTNILPIRRLAIDQNVAREVCSAWLSFPSFTLEPLEQKYTRTDANTVRYESDGGRFSRDLRVNESGIILEYPGQWVAETGTSA